MSPACGAGHHPGRRCSPTHPRYVRRILSVSPASSPHGPTSLSQSIQQELPLITIPDFRQAKAAPDLQKNGGAFGLRAGRRISCRLAQGKNNHPPAKPVDDYCTLNVPDCSSQQIWTDFSAIFFRNLCREQRQEFLYASGVIDIGIIDKGHSAGQIQPLYAFDIQVRIVVEGNS